MRKKRQKKQSDFAWIVKARGTVVRVPRAIGRLCAVIEKRGEIIECRVLLPSGEVGRFAPKYVRPARYGDAEVFNARFAQKMREKESDDILRRK